MSSTTASPTIHIFRESVTLEIHEIVAKLRDLLGAQLVAYLGKVQETRAVRQWADASRKVSASTDAKLRLAYQAASLIASRNSHTVTQAWFMGMNPQLDDDSPARLIREGKINQVGPDIMSAAKAFARIG